MYDEAADFAEHSKEIAAMDSLLAAAGVTID